MNPIGAFTQVEQQMNARMARTDYGNNPMSDRNYPCDNIIDVYFGKSNFDLVGAFAFKKQLWQCMTGQALVVKQNIEARRSQSIFGILV
jgi:hypothetical protein